MSAVPTKVVLPYMLGSFALAYVFWDVTRHKKIFGGTVPRTLTKEWEEATARKFDEGWPRVAGPPVVMNPLTRQNYRLVEAEEE
ncbi:hypothetical protein GOP47_0019023 [Adiantum capillus-veneris]|uniref:Uncharacterized protein n=1 Tax=Adiantum capillus-veneris TaxID=13818 RepID=A0A9D4Z9A6_ADICA|nr:hypothetical protein GOP47_0019023 [Adiantum capillus-veneris]